MAEMAAMDETAGTVVMAAMVETEETVPMDRMVPTVKTVLMVATAFLLSGKVLLKAPMKLKILNIFGHTLIQPTAVPIFTPAQNGPY